MVQQTDKSGSVLRNLDWWTVGLYLVLLLLGWVSVCGASYTFGDEVNLLSLDTRSGMQVVWICTAITLAFVLVMLDARFYDTFSYVIFGVMLLLLFLTIFNPHQIKGSRSWLVLGPLRLQPAEFAKFATALAVSKLISDYKFDIKRTRDFVAACMVILTPMFFIIMQRETGSALVYLAFFLMLYREGMPGSILFTGIAMVAYFVVGIRYQDLMLFGTPTSVGTFMVLLMIQVFCTGMVWVYCKNMRHVHLLGWWMGGITLAGLLFSVFVVPFNLIWIQGPLCLAMLSFLLYQWLSARVRTYLYIGLFALSSLLFFNVAGYVLNNVMEPHQRTRINVLLGLDQDISGAGYNVRQSEIAIGSGGLLGKGFLNGTQTKLKFVPEQDTDFIFCTVGEEEGFFGCAVVLGLFLALILRLIHLAERQPLRFNRIYGYSVVSIFLFHVFINVGMVLGITPVIGIPLPFFSYGGSSLWGFTILLFIFLRLDAGRSVAANA